MDDGPPEPRVPFRVRPQERITALGNPLFAWGDDRWFYRLLDDSAYTCPKCHRTHSLAASIVRDHSFGHPRSPLSPAADRAFAELGEKEGYDLVCACGLSARVVYATTELPFRSCEFVPAVREILELSTG